MQREIERAKETLFGRKMTSFVKRVVLVLTLLQALALFVRAVPSIKAALDAEQTVPNNGERLGRQVKHKRKRGDFVSYDPFQP